MDLVGLRNTTGPMLQLWLRKMKTTQAMDWSYGNRSGFYNEMVDWLQKTRCHKID